jgi:hypothetical protein
MLFQPKFKIGDIAIPNKRAPKHASKLVKAPGVITKVVRLREFRTHLMYFIQVDNAGSVGFYSDELDRVSLPVTITEKLAKLAKAHESPRVGRDNRGRFCKLINPNQMEIQL